MTEIRDIEHLLHSLRMSARAAGWTEAEGDYTTAATWEDTADAQHRHILDLAADLAREGAR